MSPFLFHRRHQSDSECSSTRHAVTWTRTWVVWVVRGALCLGSAAFTQRGVAETAVVETPAQAERPSITLAHLLRAAQRDPPAVLAALATLRRVSAEQSVAEAAYLPRLTGDGRLGTQYDNRGVLPGEAESGRIDSVSWLATATLNLDWTAIDVTRRHDIANARALTTAQRSAVLESRRAATMAAAELYLRALFAGELVGDAALTLNRRKQQQETIEALAKAGVRPTVDAVRARIDLVAASYTLDMRRTEEQAAFAALAASVGRAPEIGMRPAPLDAAVLVGPESVADTSALALQHRPELSQLRAQVQAFEKAAEAAWAGRLPSAGLYANGQASYLDVVRGSGIDGDQYVAGGGLYLRWQGGDAAVIRRRRAADGRVGEARRALQVSELGVRAEAVDAAYAAVRTRQQVEQANQVLEAAGVARTAQQQRYRAGVASLLELLDAESIEQTARRARIEAQRDHDLARARVLAVCGTLSERVR
jgi:outer membrane protein TolC